MSKVNRLGNKHCNHCKKSFPVEEHFTNIINGTKNFWVCNNHAKDHPLVRPKKKYCSVCNGSFTMDHFTEMKSKTGKNMSFCKINVEKYPTGRKPKDAKYPISPSHPEYKRGVKLRNKYGLEISDYNEMFSLQNGCCAICNKHQSECAKTLNVDHCHETGAIRKLLCTNCNSMLGHAKDNIDILKEGIKYLEKYKNK